MITKFSNTIITNDIKQMDLSKINIYQSILEIKESENDDIIFDNYIKYFLYDKQYNSSIIRFYRTDDKINVCKYDDNSTEIYSDPKEEEYDFLSINGKYIPINYECCGYEFDEDFVDFVQIKNMYIELNKNNLKNIDIIVNNKRDQLTEINHYSLIKLNDNYILIHVKNDIDTSRYFWNKKYYTYIIDSNFETYNAFSVSDNMGLFIRTLENINDESYNLDQCIDALKLFKSSFIQIRNNPELAISYITNISLIEKEEIIKYFKPVLIDRENDFEAYFNGFYSFSLIVPNTYVNYKFKTDNEYQKKLQTFKEKSNEIIKFLTGNSLINIYTGEIINNSYFSVYRDTEYIVISKSKLYNNLGNIYNTLDSNKFYFTIYKLTDEVYVEVNTNNRTEKQRHIDIINERIRICNVLSK